MSVRTCFGQLQIFPLKEKVIQNHAIHPKNLCETMLHIEKSDNIISFQKFDIVVLHIEVCPI